MTSTQHVAVEEEKVIKKKLLIQTITVCATLTSEHQEFRDIAAGLENGDELEAMLLSGGVTNYSYKVHLKDNQNVVVLSSHTSMLFGTPTRANTTTLKE